jgi:hypothetical protein
MRYRLRTLLIVLVAVPIWAYLITLVTHSPGFGALGIGVTPLVLIGITAAIFQLTKGLADGLAIAILLSPVISLASLLIVAAITHN